MAEADDILTAESQSVFLPNLAAGCPMADMADQANVERSWDRLTRIWGENSIWEETPHTIWVWTRTPPFYGTEHSPIGV